MIDKISVIIPIFNIEHKLLRKSIESVQNQTYQNLEIILVDDGSTTDCVSVCDEYALKDSRISVIHQENQGLAGARYSGLKLASSEYVMFLDGDDYLDRTTCQKLIQIINYNDIDVVIFGLNLDYQRSRVKQKVTLNKGLYTGSEVQALEKKTLDFNANVSSAVAKLIKRKIILEHQEFSQTEISQGAEDLVFSLILFHYAKSVYFWDEYLYYYVYNPSSITHTYNEKNHVMLVNCFKYMYKFLEKTEQKNLVHQLYLRFLYAVVAVGVSGYFSPTNDQSYKLKKEGYEKFLNDPFVSFAISNTSTKSLTRVRRLLLYCAKKRLYLPFLFAAKIQVKQLKAR